MLRRILQKFLPSCFPAVENAVTLNTLYGHRRSVKTGRPVDREGNPIPWFTYPATDYLEDLELGAMSVFEYGAGNGTLYWAGRVANVRTVEDDPAWREELAPRLPENASLILAASEEDYVDAIQADSSAARFDIIIIDGQHRERCARAAPACLVEGGFIILDNADWYSGAARILREHGFIQVDFKGFGPINPYTWCTSFFFDRKFEGKARHPEWPTPPRGGRNYSRS